MQTTMNIQLDLDQALGYPPQQPVTIELKLVLQYEAGKGIVAQLIHHPTIKGQAVSDQEKPIETPLQPHPKRQPKERAGIAKIRKLIEKNLHTANWDIARLCQQAGQSHTQLYRQLKNETNLTPSQFIRSIRLEKAIDLLLQTDLNISEIAFEVGFNDPNYFSRMFRESYGVSPGKYREEQGLK